MPRFHFTVSSGDILDDEDGMEFPDPGAATKHARAVASELMYHGDGMLGRPWREWTMTVTNDQGQEVFSFQFAKAKDAAGP